MLQSYKKNAEVLVYPQKNLTFAPLKEKITELRIWEVKNLEKIRYANEK